MQTVLILAGGLALFLFGMGCMTDGLRDWAGERLRSILQRSVARPARGLALGTVLGVLVQTSAGTVMLVGFVHAGFMTLAQSIPILLGMNVGTTLAMQLISFRIADYAPLFLALGVLLHLTGAESRRRPLGAALLGFGLLFLGMTMMSDAIRPHREVITPWLAHFDGATTAGLLAGTLAAIVFTAVIQSSSATLGIAFALISAGAMTRFEQAYPIVIGANIGTCVTALLGSLGANREAKRVAMAHLLFNIFGGIVGLLAAPLFYRWIGWTSPDTVRQVANANTIKMILSAIVFWPLLPAFGALVRAIVPLRGPPPETSRLEDTLLARPEDALRAVIDELGRAVSLCRESHRLNRDVILQSTPPALRRIRNNEAAVDRLKGAVHDYLVRLTRRYLSRRQAILVQHLERIMWNIERIHDHITVVSDLSLRRYRLPQARFFVEDLNLLFDLYEGVDDLLARLEVALRPGASDFYPAAQEVLSARHAYVLRSSEARRAFTEKVGRHVYPPLSGVFFSEYTVTLERMVNHARQIAETECEPDFRIKQRKLGQQAPAAPVFHPPELVKVPDYLAARSRNVLPAATPPPGKETEAP